MIRNKDGSSYKKQKKKNSSVLPFPDTSSPFLPCNPIVLSFSSLRPTDAPSKTLEFSLCSNQPTKASASFEVTILLDIFSALYLLALLSTQSSPVYPGSSYRILCFFWMIFWVEILGFRSTLPGQFSHNAHLTNGFADVL